MTISTLEGTVNFRDLGGLPLTDGGMTASGVLCRSDAISALTPQGLAALAGSGIEVIVDFRTPAEQQMAPDRLPPVRTFTTVNLPLAEGAFSGLAGAKTQGVNLWGGQAAAARAVQAAAARLPTLAGLYTGMLRDAGPVFAATARRVGAAANGGGTLVHCTAGKDRTGVAVALILDAVGVEPEAVASDYAQSEANLAGGWADKMLGMIAGMGVPLSGEIVTLVTRAPKEAIRAALEWVSREHGGAAEYLLAGGLTRAELDLLGQRLRGRQ